MNGVEANDAANCLDRPSRLSTRVPVGGEDYGDDTADYGKCQFPRWDHPQHVAVGIRDLGSARGRCQYVR
jgi:hypothetical protein